MQSKFSVSLCTAVTGEQKPLQPKLTTRVPIPASVAAPVGKNFFPNPLTIETSRIQVAQEKKDRRAVFLRQSEEESSVIHACTRREQYIATKMLLEEVWRFYTRIRLQEEEAERKLLSVSSSTYSDGSSSFNGCTSSDDESNSSLNNGSLNKSSNPFRPKNQQQKNKRSGADLVATSAKKNPKAQVGGRRFDVGMAKMLFFDIKSLMMSEVWSPSPEMTTAKHPYLFTINELRKMSLFAEWKNYM